jgi:hypothetical protein
MKVRFICDSGANIHSARKAELDTVKDLGLDDGEWEEYTDEERQETVNDWANNRLEIYWEPVE